MSRASTWEAYVAAHELMVQRRMSRASNRSNEGVRDVALSFLRAHGDGIEPARGERVNSAVEQFAWVFTGANAMFPGGVFSSRERAEEWSASHKLTGVLTAYPLDSGAYDWAVGHGYFAPKRPEQTSPTFIGRFTSARKPHVHFQDGEPHG